MLHLTAIPHDAGSEPLKHCTSNRLLTRIPCTDL